MKWKVDSFTPSDGSIVCGAAVDHVAWLSGSDGNCPTVHMLVQFSSRGIAPDDAKTIIDRVVEGLGQ